MIGDNMKFQHLRYDLGKNFVYDGKTFYNLRYISLIKCSALIFKDSCVSTYFKVWFETVKKQKSRELRYKKWKLLENRIERKIRYISTLHGLMPLIKEGMSMVGSQIFEFFEDLDDMFYAPYFLRNLNFTSQGTINIKQTVLETLGKEIDLSREMRFKLACKYFLGERVIKNYFTKLSNELQSFYKEPQNIECGMCYSIYFWIWQIFDVRKPINEPIMAVHRREDGEFEISTDGDSNHGALQHIFNKAVKDTNEMAMQYMWENFVSKLEGKDYILQNVLSTLWREEKNIKFIIYFLFYTTNNPNELIDNFIELTACSILRKLLHQPRWHNFFIDIFKILYLYFSFTDFRILFDLIITSSVLSFETKLYFLEEISRVLSSTTKSLLSMNITTYYYYAVQVLILAQDLQLLNAILAIIDKSNYDIFLDEEGIKCFHALIIKIDIDIIDTLLKKMFSMDKIILIKNAIADSRDFIDICYRIIIEKGLHNLQDVFDWILNEQTKIKEKKMYILGYRNGLLVRTLIRYGGLNKKGLPDDFLIWCLESQEFVNDYKRKILIGNKNNDPSSLVIPYKLIKTFALLLNFDFLDQIMNWSLCDITFVNSLKYRILNDDEILNSLSKTSTARIALTVFTEWCTANDQQEIKKFKLRVLQRIDFFVTLIETGRYIQAKNLINWCECSEAEMKKFKAKFFESIITYFVCHSKSEIEFEDFMEWIKIPWKTFLKCHFTGLGRNIFHVNKNFFTYHLHFIKLPFLAINRYLLN